MLSEYVLKPEARHRLAVYFLAGLFVTWIVWATVYGAGYYELDPARRVFHPKHWQLRPSGTIGIRYALAAAASFAVIYLYAIRKSWKTLGQIGKTRHWLDFHVVLGIGAPVLVTFHCAFKTRGLAGIAYWIMLAVMTSGFVGRYLYSQIPRRIDAAELSLQEMQAMSAELSDELRRQESIPPEALKPLLDAATKEDVERMSVLVVLLLMLRRDLLRPFQVARVRRIRMNAWGKIRTLGGLLRSHEQGMEKAIELARRQSWLATKLQFLSKARQIFYLWHVVHRPFSYTLAALVAIHIAVVMLMGYF